jgi:hypothetical protein
MQLEVSVDKERSVCCAFTAHNAVVRCILYLSQRCLLRIMALWYSRGSGSSDTACMSSLQSADCICSFVMQTASE